MTQETESFKELARKIMEDTNTPYSAELHDQIQHSLAEGVGAMLRRLEVTQSDTDLVLEELHKRAAAIMFDGGQVISMTKGEFTVAFLAEEVEVGYTNTSLAGKTIRIMYFKGLEITHKKANG